MQDQPNEMVEGRGRRTEQTVLVLLLTGGGQSVWSVEELVAEIGRRTDVVDALASLQAVGLVHRCDDFVFATQAALRFDEIHI